RGTLATAIGTGEQPRPARKGDTAQGEKAAKMCSLGQVLGVCGRMRFDNAHCLEIIVTYYSRLPLKEYYDLIIVGSGAGGCTLAYKLAKAGLRILMIERGEFLRPQR